MGHTTSFRQAVRACVRRALPPPGILAYIPAQKRVRGQRIVSLLSQRQRAGALHDRQTITHLPLTSQIALANIPTQNSGESHCFSMSKQHMPTVGNHLLIAVPFPHVLHLTLNRTQQMNSMSDVSN